MTELSFLNTGSAGRWTWCIRDPSNGYRTLALPFEEGRGNEMSVFTR